MTVLMHWGQTGSRRQPGRELTGKRPGGNIWRMVDKVYANSVYHPDRMNGVLEALEVEELEKLIVWIVKRLRQCRMLDRFRFDGLLTVAIDGTKIHKFKNFRCEHCTHQPHKNRKTTTFHCVLMGKIITPLGLEGRKRGYQYPKERRLRDGARLRPKRQCLEKLLPDPSDQSTIK